MATYTVYRGYEIYFDLFNIGEVSVQYCGDEVVFNNEEEAKAFIDEMRDREDAEAERAYEMRAAFGEGQTIIDVITGKKYYT